MQNQHLQGVGSHLGQHSGPVMGALTGAGTRAHLPTGRPHLSFLGPRETLQREHGVWEGSLQTSVCETLPDETR